MASGGGPFVPIKVERIDAITLATHDMARAVAFYHLLEGELVFGGPETTFSTFRIGGLQLNLVLEPPELQWSFWGRIVFHVEDVDVAYERFREAGVRPEGEPLDAEWGERYFHVLDPDGHQLSFARRIHHERKSVAEAYCPRGIVDEASEQSFPASDSPTFTPTTGVKARPIDI